jgi:hypothetical protein
VAVIERNRDAERRIQIRDATGQIIRGMLIGALVVWMLLYLVRKGVGYGR